MDKTDKSIKIVILFIILTAIMPIIHAATIESISHGINIIRRDIRQSDETLYIVIGSDDDRQSAEAASEMFQKFEIIKDKDDVETKREKYNLVIIGGPCANAAWNLFSEETCDQWPYKNGESVAKIGKNTKNREKAAILISGTSKEDTEKIISQFRDYDDFPQYSNAVEVINSFTPPKSKPFVERPRITEEESPEEDKLPDMPPQKLINESYAGPVDRLEYEYVRGREKEAISNNISEKYNGPITNRYAKTAIKSFKKPKKNANDSEEAAALESCYDSDGGEEYGKSGYVYGKYGDKKVCSL